MIGIKNCGNCAKWRPPRVGTTFGLCEKIQGIEHAIMVGGRLAAIDASGDFGMEASGELKTRDEFGCVLHEPRKEQP